MANTISNNRISNLVSSQLPFFVRNDHPNFITFLEKYYEYLEQNDKVINRIKNLQRYQNIDLTEDQFAERLYSTFLKYIPKDVLADKKILIKHIKDFYRAKGTEKATRFLLRALYDLEIDFYYPKKDILRASDGKWFIQKSLRITDTKIANVSNGNLTGLEKYIGTRIRGNTSNSTALVERIDRFFEQGTQIDELIISNVNGDFVNGELIYTIADESYISSNIFGGIINTIEITNGGSLYSVGDPVIIVSNTGVGACATVSLVTTGNIASITVFSGGAGFRVNDFLLFSGGGGAGANANVKTVLSDNSIHPNTYNIVSTIIALEANTPLNNAVYSNLSSSNVNTSISNAVNFWTYSNTGPVQTVLILVPGSNYSSKPDISVIANSVIQQLGILGRMDIIDGGQNYTIGDIIEFINVPGGYGTGAYANVTNVDNSKSNAINEVKFQLVPGHFIGGSGYDINYLPTANVISNTGNGANIIVSATLGTGANLVPTTSTIGSIQRIVISNRGSNYDSNTTINLTQSGDGNAKANITTISGTFSYPGRYLNDDGHISSYNFLQDRDYYQIFSYVIKSDQSISTYRQAVKDIIHPAGMKLFGQYEYLNESANTVCPCSANDVVESKITSKTYVKTGNTININYTAHNLNINSNVILEFTSGGSNNVRNGIYMIQNTSTDYFEVLQKSSLSNVTIVNPGLLYNANSYLVITGDGYGANATYTTNANGSIVSVTINEPGIGFTLAPTITANGSNSISATFTANIAYSNNTSGNVDVIIAL